MNTSPRISGKILLPVLQQCLSVSERWFLLEQPPTTALSHALGMTLSDERQGTYQLVNDMHVQLARLTLSRLSSRLICRGRLRKT